MDKKCRFCGELFTPKSNRQVYCEREHWRACPSCGKLYIEKFNENLSKPPRLCSPRCGSAKKHELPEFQEIIKLGNTVIIDSTSRREKYDNLTISKWYHKQGLKCIHLFPGENIDKLISWCTVNNTLYANEFQIYKLNLDYAAEFLEQNDIVPYNKNTSLAVGLVKDYNIYQVLTFSSPRYNKNYEHELVRVCTRSGYSIIGGLDALSSAASLQLGVSSCIAYQDLSKVYDDSLLRNIGLRVDHVDPPHLLPSDVYDCGVEVLVF